MHNDMLLNRIGSIICVRMNFYAEKRETEKGSNEYKMFVAHSMGLANEV